jgi:Ca2+-binding RTX toxin-like protein
MATINGTSGNDIITPSFVSSGVTGSPTPFPSSAGDIINGGAGADTLDGGTGIDTLSYASSTAAVTVNLAANTASGGHATGDVIVAGSFENLTGSSFNDSLTGNSGNNILDGGVGADTMNGGDGNDTYYVDNVGDIVKESFDDALAGTADTVLSSVSYTLSPGTAGNQGYGIENLTLTGTASTDATGNAKDNVITGNSNNNILRGAAGNDTINGGAGADVLIGGLGVDTMNGGDGNDGLDGGLGADKMSGGTGNDTYYVDSMSDSVVELTGQGTDTVFSSVSTSIKWLPSNVENLTLTGTAIFGDGNDLANVITGNASNNSLFGYGGNDVLVGGFGADRLTGGLGPNDLGVDKFRFNFLEEGVDIITDFSFSQGDKIQIVKASFDPTGATPSIGQFSYNSLTGDLFYDPDGSAFGPTKFANLETKPSFIPKFDIEFV